MNAPRVNGRNKGSTFEREIAQELFLLTGIAFKRDLEQYRAADRGDLIPDDQAWPFLIECKRYAAGKQCLPAWKDQASKAAKAAGRVPVVVYKFDRAPIRCAVPLSALCPKMPADQWAEITLRGLAFLAAEKMAAAS